MLKEAFLNDGTDNFRIHGYTQAHWNESALMPPFGGFGMPAPRSNRPDRSQRHGAVELTKFYQPRVFDLNGYLKATNMTNLWTRVDDFKKHLRLGVVLLFKFELESNARTLQCYVKAEGFDIPLDLPAPFVTYAGQLVAADPRMYAQTLSSINEGDGSVTFTNDGNFISPPIITLTGPSATVVISHTQSGRSIKLINLSATTVLDFSTRTLTHGGSSAPAKIDAANTRWFELYSGTNTITLTTGSATDLKVEWRHAYL